jgi:hypothetical protein
VGDDSPRAALRHRRPGRHRPAPRQERLAATAAAGDEAGYASTLASVRTSTYGTLVLVVIAIFFMTVKPFS